MEQVIKLVKTYRVADGFQVEVTRTAQEAGIRFPVFITRTAFDAYVTVPSDVTGQDEAGRLWDVVWMLRFAIRKAQPGQTRSPLGVFAGIYDLQLVNCRHGRVAADRNVRAPFLRQCLYWHIFWFPLRCECLIISTH